MREERAAQQQASPVMDPEGRHADKPKHVQWADAYKHIWRQRPRDTNQALASGRYRQAVAATRALVVAQALAALMLGFILDDLAVLRTPGFLVGIIAAVAILGLAGLPQGAWIARRLNGRTPEDQQALLGQVRATGRVLLFLMLVAGLLFLTLIGSGVPPWA